jgi:hypothetical protein
LSAGDRALMRSNQIVHCQAAQAPRAVDAQQRAARKLDRDAARWALAAWAAPLAAAGCHCGRALLGGLAPKKRRGRRRAAAVGLRLLRHAAAQPPGGGRRALPAAGAGGVAGRRAAAARG